MPVWSEEDIRAAVDRGLIAGVSLDTSIFYKYNLRLDSKGLMSFRQFSGTRTQFILAETVVLEIKKGITTSVSREFQQLKELSNSLKRFVDIPEVFTSDSIDSVDISNHAFQRYITSCDARIISAEEYCSIDQVQAAYFQTKPPFADRTSKKEEFPDAIALSTIEGWAESCGKHVLVASKDSGWISYCSASKWLIWVDNVGSMLDLFNHSNTFASDLVRSIFEHPLQGELEGVVEYAVENYAENISLDVDATSPVYFETDDYGAAAAGYEIVRPAFVKILEANDEGFTVSVPMTINLKTEISVEYLVKDEGEHLSLGSDWIEHEFSVKVDLVLSASRPGAEGIIFSECEVNGPSSVRVDLGILHPFREE